MLASVLMLTTLSGCAGFGNKEPVVQQQQLAEIPADIRVCFNQMVPAPIAGKLTKQQVFKIIADLKRSEKAKSQCGKRLIEFYEAQK